MENSDESKDTKAYAQEKIEQKHGDTFHINRITTVMFETLFYTVVGYLVVALHDVIHEWR